MWACVRGTDLGEERQFSDLLGRFCVQLCDERRLRLQGFLPAGLHKIEFATRPGEFDVSGLTFECTEYPSMRQVPTGPWDLNHMTNEMVAPVCDIEIDGEFWAQGWARLNTPEAQRGGFIEFSLGVEILTPGPHTIDLAIPESEKRWSWKILDCLTVQPDERACRPLTPKASLAESRPRCFMGTDELESLRAACRGKRARLWESYAALLDSDVDGTYFFRNLRLALGVLIEGKESWLKELADRLGALADRENWGFNPVRHALGYNNDRDAGCALFAAAVAYDWCGHLLPRGLRLRLRARLAEVAEYVYRFTLVQRDYLPGAADLHALGTWIGPAAAAVALYGEEPRAEAWLSWMGGVLERVGRMMSHDGVTGLGGLCAAFAFYMFGVVNDFVEEDVLAGIPFFERFGAGYVNAHEEPPVRCSPDVAELAAYAARRAGDPVAGWLARQRPRGRRGGRRPSLLSPIWYPKGRGAPPAEPGLCRRFETGALLLGGDASPSLRVHVHAGNSAGAGMFFGNNYHHARYNVTRMGDFTFRLKHDALVGGPSGYRARAEDHTLVTVDGGGSI